MLDPIKILLARKWGKGRYALISTAGETIPEILAKFGLKPFEDGLRDVTAAQASQILKQLLWKDAAYNAECMSETEAAQLTAQIMTIHGGESCKYLSNADPQHPGSFYPMTEATLDSGIIIIRPDNIHICIWFEDED